MKKFVSLGLFSLFCFPPFLLAGCAPSAQNPAPIPYGIWHSDDPDLTLYIDPNVEGFDYYSSEYLLDGEMVDCFLTIDMHQDGVMLVQPRSAITSEGIQGGTDYTFFRGRIHEDNGMLFYKLFFSHDDTNYKEIVFEKIGEYPIVESSSTNI